jgi:hypothetical protein
MSMNMKIMIQEEKKKRRKICWNKS